MMKFIPWKFLAALSICCCFSSLSVSAKTSQTIPIPLKVEPKQGQFELKSLPVVYTTENLKNEAAQLHLKLEKRKLAGPVTKGTKNQGGVYLKLNTALKTPESYKLTIVPQGIAIEGADRAGVFYGIQTLCQEITATQNEGRTSLPCMEVTDAPRYPWRGFMLDEARHFFGMEKVKQLLDMMAYHKLNKFHWHLTDEPGWRIEIKKYPLLTTVGGQGNWSQLDSKEVRYYTQDQIKEIIQYAADRHIEIIPEIDMPGHATAANRAYPEFSGGGTKDHPEFTFNPGKEGTYAFLTDILKEVAELFPSQYLNIGGDEVSFAIKSWETNPDVLALVKREGLKSYKDAEGYFVRRMNTVVKDLGKTSIGWDELLETGVDPSNTVILWWRHDKVNILKKSLDKGFTTIMCPRRPLYFDFIQDGSHKWGRTWGGFCSQQDVYEFPDKGFASWNLPDDQMKLITGIQANLWTERIHTEDRMDFMIYPRIFALAESAWSAHETKNYEDFTRRMENSYKLMDTLGINYFDIRNPGHHPEPKGAERGKRDLPMDFKD